MSVNAFAKLAGVDHSTIREAIAHERIVHAIVIVKGKPKISDPELALSELRANTRGKSDGAFSGATDDQGPEDGDEITFNEARRLREIEVWRITKVKREIEELNFLERRGELIDTDEARQSVLDEYANIRTRMLGLSTRIRQRIQSLTSEDIKTIDKLIREALEALSDGEE